MARDCSTPLLQQPPRRARCQPSTRCSMPVACRYVVGPRAWDGMVLTGIAGLALCANPLDLPAARGRRRRGGVWRTSLSPSTAFAAVVRSRVRIHLRCAARSAVAGSPPLGGGTIEMRRHTACVRLSVADGAPRLPPHGAKSRGAGGLIQDSKDRCSTRRDLEQGWAWLSTSEQARRCEHRSW